MLPEARIVFENDAIRVVFLPGHVDHLLITFGDAAELAGGARFFAEPVARAAVWPALGIMAKDAHWYPADAIAAALPSLRGVLDGFAKRIVYGSSMGGYAAIKYSGVLGAGQVIAYCPQYSLDPGELAGGRSGYEGAFRPAMRGMRIRAEDIAGTVNIFFDPYDAVDANHARLIAASAPGARLFHVPNVGHHVAPVLAGTVLTQAIFAACEAGDTDRVYRLINGTRRGFGWRQHHVLRRGVRRHGGLVARALRGLMARENLVIPEPARLAPGLFDALARRGEAELALSVLRRLGAPLSAPRARLIARDLDDLARGEPWVSAGLMTVHETMLIYDAVTARLSHRVLARNRLDSIGKHRVLLCALADMGILAVRIEHAIFACCAGVNGEAVSLRPLHETSPDVSFVARWGENYLRVTHCGNFLHAMPDGGVHFAPTGERLWQRLISL